MTIDLVADIGNTRTHLGLFEGERLLASGAVPHGEVGDMRRGWEAFVDVLPAPARVGLADVNARVGRRFREWVEVHCGLPTLGLGDELRSPVRLAVERPEQVGADRIANAVWAARTLPHQAAVVVDLGTAITFDVVSPAGEFLGGVIAAGVGTCAAALHQRTALLPLVELRAPRDAGAPPPRALGATTEACLEGGLFWGAVGLVNAVCGQLALELGVDPVVVATGGDAPAIAPHCPCVARIVPDLTLHGVRLALQG